MWVLVKVVRYRVQRFDKDCSDKKGPGISFDCTVGDLLARHVGGQ